MKVIITLESMTFHARHGVMEQERTVGGRYLVDISYTADCKAVETDNIEDTVNYAEIFDAVKREMAQPSNLIEHVAGRIMKSVRLHFPQIIDLTVKVSKLNPPVNGEAAKATVTLSESGRTDCHPLKK